VISQRSPCRTWPPRAWRPGFSDAYPRSCSARCCRGKSGTQCWATFSTSQRTPFRRPARCRCRGPRIEEDIHSKGKALKKVCFRNPDNTFYLFKP